MPEATQHSVEEPHILTDAQQRADTVNYRARSQWARQAVRGNTANRNEAIKNLMENPLHAHDHKGQP